MKSIINFRAILIAFAITMVIPSLGNAAWQISKPLSKDILCTEWTSLQNGFAGVEGEIYKTTNGGAVWIVAFTDAGTRFRSIKFINAQTGIATCGGGIYKTTNGGINWNFYLADGVVASLGNFCIINDQTFFGINYGTGAGIYKTTNGGVNWIASEPRTGGIAVALSYTGSKLLATYRDTVYSSTNLGNTWNAVQFFKGNTYSMAFNNGVAFLGQSSIQGAKVYKSTNQGMIWTETLDTTIKKVTIVSIAFANANTGYLAGYRYENNTYLGVIYKTTNNGLNWSLAYSKEGVAFNSVACTSEKVIAGADSGYLVSAEHTTGVFTVSSTVPDSYTLGQNYPNPFNPTTNIEFSVKKSGNVKLSVFDIGGREVKVLLNEVKQPGTYKADFNASNMPSGTYFYRLETEGFSQTKKMTLVK